MSIHIPARPRRTSAVTFALSLAVLAGGASQASAQAGHLVQIGGNTNPGTAMVSPRSGAKGTTMHVATHNLPAHTSVQFMIGALQDGFEVVSTLMTDESGRFGGKDTVAITVPDWVQTNRSYLVMLTDTNYKPLAAADMFHPTDPTGGLSRRGVVKFDDPHCPTLTGPGGEIYFLTGNVRGVKGGDDIVLKGHVAEFTPCGETTTIRVDSLHAAGL